MIGVKDKRDVAPAIDSDEFSIRFRGHLVSGLLTLKEAPDRSLLSRSSSFREGLQDLQGCQPRAPLRTVFILADLITWSSVFDARRCSSFLRWFRPSRLTDVQ